MLDIMILVHIFYIVLIYKYIILSLNILED